MQSLLVATLAFSLSNTPFNKFEINLPPINQVYKTSINLPFIGPQNIEYERTDLYVSQVRLDGIINECGNVYLDKNNLYDYTFDEVLKRIVDKYKCSLENPYYDPENDIVVFKLKIKVIKFGKTIVLKKI
tara:strand:- start:223 stop:612 length:390 start_codon:yes stop_codon:yes gene_type:complete